MKLLCNENKYILFEYYIKNENLSSQVTISQFLRGFSIPDMTINALVATKSKELRHKRLELNLHHQGFSLSTIPHLIPQLKSEFHFYIH